MIRPDVSAPLATTALAVAFACALPAGAFAHDHAAKRGRLVFADHEKPVVRVLDLDTGEVTHSFDLSRPNPVFATAEDRRHVVIKTGDDAGTVRILDNGLTFESHGDHEDVDKGEVKLLDLTFKGDRPAHVVSENDWLAVFYDGLRPWEAKSNAKAYLVPLDSLGETKPEVAEWLGPAPQHGIAIPLGQEQWLISVTKPAYAKGDNQKVSSRPDGYEILDRTKGWARIASFNDTSDPAKSCKEFHGHASLANTHVFGCNQAIAGDERGDGGVLVIGQTADGSWGARKIAYPDERRSSTIKAAAGGQYMVANYGLKSPYDAFLRIDPKAASLSKADIFAVPGGQPTCQYEISPDGRRVVNLTQDGKLRVYDIAPEWKEIATFDAVAAFDCAFGAATPVPSLAIIGNSAFVSDPENSRIREFHLNTLKQGLDIPVDGKPANLAGGGGAG
ncbi:MULTISPECIES: hypothetical protein [unclassified Chelatococcus]|uniref:hypothetical protein n=1 Tax=unclassified Chelatococcus TaxID=2638111 RepID=UPI00224BAC79|nr:hypothetical protein [Chelatococcus sp.]MCO5075795.1 hypothetical protein [Chelatococcus sp.]CAH1649937.1 conserved exported hypothetical protein [Hyphomicrobiales bacterium]CAH1666803.1 conserved exported hypothetical protein [Hyphomicrobiales bacterium]